MLFLEDIAEKPYRIDRLLTQMLHAGKFAGVRGVVLGTFHDCDEADAPGRVLEVTGSGQEALLTIRFDQVGVKKIFAKWVKPA